MPGIHDWGLFCLAALIMVLTPGPNMIYLVSRSICQGRTAGLVSLLGVVVGFLFHMFAVNLGLTAIFLTIPYAYIAVKMAGAAYLLWLAWGALIGVGSPFTPKVLSADSTGKLFRMGFVTNVLNPKVAIFYMSLLPQFIRVENGSVLTQSLVLGATQIAISFTVNFLIVLSAGVVCEFFQGNPRWLRFQKWIMGLTLSGLAVRLMAIK